MGPLLTIQHHPRAAGVIALGEMLWESTQRIAANARRKPGIKPDVSEVLSPKEMQWQELRERSQKEQAIQRAKRTWERRKAE